MAKVKNPTKAISGHALTKRTIRKFGGDEYTHNVRSKKKVKKCC